MPADITIDEYWLKMNLDVLTMKMDLMTLFRGQNICLSLRRIFF